MRGATEAQLERLSGALNRALRLRRIVEGGDLSYIAVRDEIHGINCLYDACIDVGMAHGEPSEIEWASLRVAEWLCSAGAS